MLSTDDLWNIPNSIEKVFGLLATTRTGVELLTRAYPYIAQGIIEFRGYPIELLQELRATRHSDEISGACCITSAEHALIYFDPSTPIGVMAILFAHELTHALDTQLWCSVKTGKGIQTAVEGSESTARHNQKQVTEELFQRYPQFHRKVIHYFANSRILFPETLDLNASR